VLIQDPDLDNGEEEDDETAVVFQQPVDGAPRLLEEDDGTTFRPPEAVEEEDDCLLDAEDSLGDDGDDLSLEAESWQMSTESARDLDVPLAPLPGGVVLPKRCLQKNSYVLVFCGREWELAQINFVLNSGKHRFKILSTVEYMDAVFTEGNHGRDVESADFKWVYLNKVGVC
jgi:hypothetical protein